MGRPTDRYLRKFLLISFLFSVPLGLLTYLWLAQIGEQLAFTRQERAGLRSGLHRRVQQTPPQALPLLTDPELASLRRLTSPRRGAMLVAAGRRHDRPGVRLDDPHAPPAGRVDVSHMTSVDRASPIHADARFDTIADVPGCGGAVARAPDRAGVARRRGGGRRAV